MTFVNFNFKGYVDPWLVNVSLVTDIMYDKSDNKTIIYFLSEPGRRTVEGNVVDQIIEKMKKAGVNVV